MSEQSRNNYVLHVLIPELFTHVTPGLRLEFLERLLSRGYVEYRAHPAWMSSLFGLPVNKNPLPIAPLTRLVDANDSGDKIWLRADPVHLRADRDHVFLFDAASAFTITPAEVINLIHEINTFYAKDGLEFSAPTPTRWYVSLPELPKLITYPVADVLGKDIHAYLPDGDDKLVWRQRLNEVQMLLHQSQVNVNREARGELPINSLWFWGLGRQPDPPKRRWAQVWSDDLLAQGLACLTNTPNMRVPATGTDWLAQLIPGEHLLTLSAPRGEDWSAWLSHLEQVWFMHLFNALKKRQVDMVVLYPGDERVFVVTDSRARHWWRRRRSWQSFG
ncbi:MAG: hypothetical protein ABFS56_23465 [Pseudomonadota bacterium]